MTDFRFGIEHEVAFQNAQGVFADFSNTPFATFQRLVDALPEAVGDAASLRQGDAGIRRKRWYIEGYERFNEQGEMIDCLPKGIEIRTTIHRTIHAALAELKSDYHLLIEQAASAGFTPVATSYNPQQRAFIPDPPLNAFERAQQADEPPEDWQTADIAMLTYGPDLNLSQAGMSSERLVDVGRKLTWLSPFIVPFSFDGKHWQSDEAGELLSLRTWQRTGARPAVLVFPADSAAMLDSNPTLTKTPRHPAEAGRIEFKAFDSCANLEHYASLLALLKGLVLDESLAERATVPDKESHRLAAKTGFAAATIRQQAERALHAAWGALTDEAERGLLLPLFAKLA